MRSAPGAGGDTDVAEPTVLERTGTGDPSDTQVPLRIGIMVDGARLALWQIHLLEKLQRTGHARIVLALVRGQVHDTPARPASRSTIGAALFHRYVAWDRRKFRLPTDPFDTVPLDTLSGECAAWTVTPRTTQWSDRLEDADLETLRGHELDVIIRFGWRIVRGEVLSVPRYGIWSYHHGDNRLNRGGPPCFWETVKGQTLTGATLQLLSDDVDDGQVLARGFTATDPVSVNLTRSRLYWLSAEILPDEIARLHALGGERYLAEVQERNRQPRYYSAPLLSDRNLSLGDSIAFVAGRLRAYVSAGVFRRRFEEKWVLYFRLGPGLASSLWQFERLESGNDRYWADPHVIARDGRYYVFVEEFPYATQRGHIAVIPIDADGQVGEARTVLRESHHLSYPFVFEHDGRTFMVPESGTNGTIDLYECTAFPDTWSHVKTLMHDVYAVDTTLIRRDGRWWLFTNLCETAGRHPHDRLHLYSAEELWSEAWERHPANAIVCDPTRSRPGGALYEHQGRLYRPAQDCSRDYGYAVRVMEVTELTRERYAEHQVTSITPDWAPDLRGVHTLTHVPGLTIVDAKTIRPRSELDFSSRQ